MKNTSKIIFAIMLITSVLFVGGCKKGDTGPAGKDGKNGSANVTTRTLPVSSWTSTSSFYYTQLSFPELTSDNVNSAAVLVYWGTGNNTWVAVPYTYVSSPNNYFMGFLATAGLIEVRWTCNSVISIGSDPNAIFGATVQLKAVVIPPSMIKPNVNHHSYSEVKAAYSLKD